MKNKKWKSLECQDTDNICVYFLFFVPDLDGLETHVNEHVNIDACMGICNT